MTRKKTSTGPRYSPTNSDALAPSPGFVRPDDSVVGVRPHELVRARLAAGPAWPGSYVVPRLPAQAVTSTTPTAASSRPPSCTRRSRSPRTNRASSTVMPGYSDVRTTARPKSPARVAST